MKGKELWKAVKETAKEHPKVTILYIFLRLSVFGVMIAQITNQDWENVFLCLLTLVLFMMPGILEHTWKIDIPDTLEIIILLFIYAAEILGEISEYYLLIPAWDTALHTITGFLAAAVGFSLIDIVNRSESTRLYLSPIYVCIAAFCFSMTIGVLWEFFEFAADQILNVDMQKDTIIHTIKSVSLNPDGKNKAYVIKDITSVAVNGVDLGIDGYLDIGLHDTMKDLFVNFIGAFTYSVFGFFYLRFNTRRSSKVVKSLKVTKSKGRKR